MQIALIGAPTDVGASDRGASMGPEALRVAQLQSVLRRRGLDVIDRGNLERPAKPVVTARRTATGTCAKSSPGTGSCTRRCTTNSLADACRCCSAAITASRSARSVPSPVIAATSGRKLRVLWFDAHADFNTNVLSPSGNLHGMPVACLCGFGPAELVSIGGYKPMLDPPQTCDRSASAASMPAKSASCTKSDSKCSTCATSTRWACATRWTSRSRIDADTHLHVSFDVDFLDPDIAPGVGTTVPGGPTYREAQLCMEMIADTGRLASLDVMELNPALDVRNRTAEVAVDLIGSLFGKSTLMRKDPAVS